MTVPAEFEEGELVNPLILNPKEVPPMYEEEKMEVRVITWPEIEHKDDEEIVDTDSKEQVAGSVIVDGNVSLIQGL